MYYLLPEILNPQTGALNASGECYARNFPSLLLNFSFPKNTFSTLSGYILFAYRYRNNAVAMSINFPFLLWLFTPY
jgi:hypothetical protein